MTAAMSHREADADAWELGEHPCQINGHTASHDPQVTDCQRCGVDLSALEPEDDDETTEVIFSGRDKRGVAHGGRTSVASIPEFVSTRFRAGWSFLVVADGADYNHRLGAVTNHPDTGKRTWWAES